jgi:hypothetical protein
VIRRSLTSALLLLSSSLWGSAEWNGTITAGAKYNSNVEYLYLIDRLSADDPPRKESFFALLGGDIALSFGDDYQGRISYSLFSESGLDNPELSRFDQYIGGTFSHVFNEKLLFDCSVMLHHVAERWPVPRQLYVDLFGWATVMYDHNDHFSSYATARAGYYHDIDPFKDRRLDYFRGPAAGIEGGWYLYPAADQSYLKTAAGIDLNWFRDEEYDRWTDRSTDVLGVSNKFLRAVVMIEGALVRDSFTVSAALRYTYQYWLGIDMFRYIDWEKRRIEHTIFVQPEFEYRFFDHYAVRATGSVMKKMSNIGENRNDYTDYSMLQFTGAVSFSYSF